MSPQTAETVINYTYQLAAGAFVLGAVAVFGAQFVTRLVIAWIADRKYRAQYKIHRRSPFGI
jgi:hypothetical protein